MKSKEKKKTFFKIKEKLVLVQSPKNLFSFKIVGVLFFSLGVIFLVLAVSYWYYSPRLNQDKPLRVVEVEVEKKIIFTPEKVMFPGLGLDYQIKNGTPEGKLVPKDAVVNVEDEILVFGSDGLYKKFLVTEVEVKESSESGSFTLDKTDLNIVLPIKIKPQKEIRISAKLSAEE